MQNQIKEQEYLKTIIHSLYHQGLLSFMVIFAAGGGWGALWGEMGKLSFTVCSLQSTLWCQRFSQHSINTQS